MGVRSSIAGSLTRAAKAFGGNEPAAMRQAAEQVSQMGPQDPFSPGEPIGPYDGYSRQPRSHNYVTGTNIATRPRTHERVSFGTLRGLIESYDVASIAIWHRIDSIRSLDWKLMAADGYGGDVTDAIATGMAALKKPDRESAFEGWLAKWLWDVLAYDAGSLYRMRNRAGRVVGLAPVDGSTLAPLLDYWGNTPQEPAEAYVQYINGLPWNWLTKGDLIYEPFRPRTNSPYGQPPIETVILNANTDLRFQVYFLQRFTQGNVPEAFASAPESWSPDVIEQWQNYWDGFVYGEQAVKHQVKWIPGGSTFAWSNEKDFSDTFSLFMMRKTCAAFHVVPSDLGFTEDVNRSSGESQADVQHKVGELPFGRYIERILTSFLADDLGLPLKFGFDWGEEQDDRLAQAQADDIYIKNGTVGASEVREWRFGEPEPEGRTVPRFIFSSRAGPIPLNSLFGVAGAIDQATAAPAADAALPHTAFETIPGVAPVPPLEEMPLAEEEFGPKALPPAPAPQPGTVAKEDGAPSTGITTATGITSYDGPGERDDDEDREASVAKEMAAFRRFEKARRRAGEWRDFRFEALTPVTGHNLNDAGRLAVRKAAGEVAVAGLAVQAQDTGRVLMLQRALDPEDPAGGTWECPGGHLEQGESPLQGAWREWAEETGAIPPPGQQGGTWTSPNGIYQGIVWTVPSESDVPVRCGALVLNPDDPDGDCAEAIAWWDPADLPGNSAVRPELLADIDAVMAALGCGPAACCGGDCCAGGCCGGESGCTCGPAAVAKAGGADPKGRWPGWKLDGPAVAYWAPLLTAAVTASLTPSVLRQLAAEYLAGHPDQQGGAPGKQERNTEAADWLTVILASLGASLTLDSLALGVATDGFLIGALSAAALTSGQPVDAAGWQPGDAQAARDRLDTMEAAGAFAAGTALGTLLAAAAARAAASMARAVLGALGRVLAGADAAQSVASVAAALRAALGDPGLAGSAVADEITASSGEGALCGYGGEGVQYGEWVTDPSSKSGPCPVCLANEAAGRVPIGDPYPSGDAQAPVHPHCNCQIVPA